MQLVLRSVCISSALLTFTLVAIAAEPKAHAVPKATAKPKTATQPKTAAPKDSAASKPTSKDKTPAEFKPTKEMIIGVWKGKPIVDKADLLKYGPEPDESSDLFKKFYESQKERAKRSTISLTFNRDGNCLFEADGPGVSEQEKRVEATWEFIKGSGKTLEVKIIMKAPEQGQNDEGEEKRAIEPLIGLLTFSDASTIELQRKDGPKMFQLTKMPPKSKK